MKKHIAFALLALMGTMMMAGCTKDVQTNGMNITPSKTEVGKEKKSDDAPSELEVDYSQYFEGLKGSAVFYNSEKETYYIHDRQLAEYESSPCSTFKIISCLMGLEKGVIKPSDSVLKWDGVQYPIDSWNQDLDYQQAFKASCVWYFRKVIDVLGKDYVQDVVNTLNYGNRDIDQWEGTLNNLNFPERKDLKEINGFWLESSLQISPKQQVDVLKKIFGDKTPFSQDNLELVKELMLVDNDNSAVKIYGKTGSGLKDQNWGDAWFVGFFEYKGETTYFAVRLNEPNLTGKKAKEIAINIIQSAFAI